MMECWNLHPYKRPCFTTIRSVVYDFIRRFMEVSNFSFISLANMSIDCVGADNSEERSYTQNETRNRSKHFKTSQKLDCLTQQTPSETTESK